MNALHLDGLGSVRAVTDAAGVAVERTGYRPYGEEVAVQQPLTLPEAKGFIGERLDGDAGLQYLNARYYDPRLGMFVQPDWWEVTEPGVGTNRYAYAFGDPVNGRDPGGNSFVDRLYDKLFGDGAFNRRFGDKGSAWSDRTFGNDSEKWASSAYKHETGGLSDTQLSSIGSKWWDNYEEYKKKRLEGASGIAAGGDGFVADVAMAGSGAGLVLNAGRGAWALLRGAAAVTSTKVIAAGGFVPIKEGIYEFGEGAARYVGQASDIQARLAQHIASGRLVEGATVKVTEVLGGKTAREIAEHFHIQEITSGVSARFSDLVTNMRDPIGRLRSHLLD